jgi:hypothetical protein
LSRRAPHDRLTITATEVDWLIAQHRAMAAAEKRLGSLIDEMVQDDYAVCAGIPH